MKSLKTKVIMSAIVLVFALIATIGSTYAWFTVSETVTVNQITISVESSESLLVRMANGETEVEGDEYTDYGWTLDSFSSVVSVTESAAYTNYATWKILPVTCLTDDASPDAFGTNYAGIDITDLRRISDLTAANRPLVSAGSNSASGYYLEFEFWLLRTSTDGTKLNVTMNYTATGTYADALFIGTVGDTSLEAENQTLFGNNLDFGFAFTSSDAGFNNDASDSVSTVGGAVATALTAIEGTEGVTSINYLETANVPELVTLLIWVEGWDADATNAVMGAIFSLDITFGLAV